MEENKVKVIFIFDGISSTVQCLKEDKMKDICQEFAKKEGKNIDFFLFLYEGNKVNFELSFNEQANSGDRNNNQMNISVYKNESYNLINSEFGGFLDNIFLSNKKIQEIMDEVKVKIEREIKEYTSELIVKKLKNIKEVLLTKIEETKKK